MTLGTVTKELQLSTTSKVIFRTLNCVTEEVTATDKNEFSLLNNALLLDQCFRLALSNRSKRVCAPNQI
jgi:hypothetical protein